MVSIFKFLISIFIFATSLAQAGECDRALIQSAEEHIRRGSFYAHRDLKDYEIRYLGPSFVRALTALKPTDTWVDMGSGTGLAIAEYVQRTEGFGARAVGVTHSMDRNERVSATLRAHPFQLRFLTGRFVEEIPNEEIGRPQLITDLYGPLSYTADFQIVLQKYLDLLAPGGQIFLFIESGRINRFWRGNDLIDLTHFLKTIPGIQVTVFETYDSLLLIEKNDETVSVPHLKLRLFEKSSPPVREYELK